MSICQCNILLFFVQMTDDLYKNRINRFVKNVKIIYIDIKHRIICKKGGKNVEI